MRFSNLAFKVPDLGDAERAVAAMPGGSVIARHSALGAEFLQVEIGGVTTNLFESALYETAEQPIPYGPLHSSFFVDSLEAALADPFWSAALTWGPQSIEGGFGRRRIAFFEPLPGTRIELMEDLDA